MIQFDPDRKSTLFVWPNTMVRGRFHTCNFGLDQIEKSESLKQTG